MRFALLSQKHLDALSFAASRLADSGLEKESQALRELLVEIENAPREVPASTAAKILGVTPQTIRNWIRGGVLPGRRDLSGHFHVRLGSLETALQMRAVLPDAPAGLLNDDEIDAEIEAVRAERRVRSTAGW